MFHSCHDAYATSRTVTTPIMLIFPFPSSSHNINHGIPTNPFQWLSHRSPRSCPNYKLGELVVLTYRHSYPWSFSSHPFLWSCPNYKLGELVVLTYRHSYPWSFSFRSRITGSSNHTRHWRILDIPSRHSPFPLTNKCHHAIEGSLLNILTISCMHYTNPISSLYSNA